MAKREIWDDEMLRQELASATNALESIPHRHLKRLQRVARLQVYLYRYFLMDRLAALESKDPSTFVAVSSESQGRVTAWSQLDGVVTSILDGTFQREDEEAGFEKAVQTEAQYAQQMRERYEDEFVDE